MGLRNRCVTIVFALDRDAASVVEAWCALFFRDGRLRVWVECHRVQRDGRVGSLYLFGCASGGEPYLCWNIRIGAIDVETCIA